MLEVLFFLAAGAFFYYNLQNSGSRAKPGEEIVKSASPQVVQLTEYAERLLREKKYLAAEKAYLRILKLDHKNAPAYHHLGMIYLALHNYADAIESLQIAAQLAPDGASYQHLATALFDNGNNVKAIAAFEKAIMFEPTAGRYLRLAKAQQKLAAYSKMLSSLEKAVEIDPNAHTYAALAEGYEVTRDPVQAQQAWRKVLELEPANAKAAQHSRRPMVENTP